MTTKTHLDSLARAVTYGSCAVLGIAALGMLLAYWSSPRERVDAIVLALEVGFLAAIVLGAWLFAPRGYEVKDGALRILRPWGPVVIPLSDIRNVELLTQADLAGLWRVGGVGGLFGYYGWYWNRELGRVTLYLGNKENPIAVETANRGKWILSPDSPDLLRALQDAWAG